jgi:hypothetical protein
MERMNMFTKKARSQLRYILLDLANLKYHIFINSKCKKTVKIDRKKPEIESSIKSLFLKDLITTTSLEINVYPIIFIYS